MKKYAVFTRSRKSGVIPEYELSVSNKIIKDESIDVVLTIVDTWVKSILPGYGVYQSRGTETVFGFRLSLMNTYELQIVPMECNVRFRICKVVYSKFYVSKEV